MDYCLRWNSVDFHSTLVHFHVTQPSAENTQPPNGPMLLWAVQHHPAQARVRWQSVSEVFCVTAEVFASRCLRGNYVCARNRLLPRKCTVFAVHAEVFARAKMHCFRISVLFPRRCIVSAEAFAQKCTVSAEVYCLCRDVGTLGAKLTMPIDLKHERVFPE